ncbi:MAG TPA: peptidoglycan recognition family protein [Phycisphaerae bacterium]|nr:peptidoglycan recognition family protein [Phycisphaerae bacterium]
MGGSRTVKTLMALLAAMTLGALALMVLETEPIRPTAQPLVVLSPRPVGAARVIFGTRVPVQAVQWRYIVVHASSGRRSRPARRCHFLVEGGAEGTWRVTATDAWLDQRAGGHIGGFWRDSSIGICVIGDFSRRRPERGQFASLVDLVNTLQEVCKISADRIYLHSDLVAGSSSPGAAFPAEEFSARLLHSQR